MNLLLLAPHELNAEGRAVLEGRRAEHLIRVLAVTTGQTLRAGCLDHSSGSARVVAVTGERVEVEYSAQHPAGQAQDKVLLLALPRPKVLSRCLQHAAALGFTRIALFRCYRVDKSQLNSHKLKPEDMQRQLILGLEQARRVHLPEVRLFTRFKPFVEDELDAFVRLPARFVAHPEAASGAHAVSFSDTRYCLALGPEGGFIPYELEQLQQRDFQRIRADTGPLRVESALSYFTGQLDLRTACL